MRRTIIVKEYDPAWPAEFEKLRRALAAALEGVCLRIEHVGSTSVPGLAAKPILDIDVLIPRGAFPEAKARLSTLGYTHAGDLGIPGRESFDPHDLPGFMEQHLYVCEEGAGEFARHTALRDYLRANDGARDEYSALKRSLAAAFPHDIDSYIAGKTEFIEGIYEKCGVTPAFRPMTREALRDVYEHMKLQFPAAELKPLARLDACFADGREFGYTLSDGSGLLCYALLLSSPDTPFVQLDYLAVLPHLQGGGYGSEMLRRLAQLYPRVIADVEDPASARDPAEIALRARRIRFYRRNCFRLTGARGNAWGVDFAYMATGGSDQEVADAMRALYRSGVDSEEEYRAQFRVTP